jgi:sorting nexin-1/2
MAFSSRVRVYHAWPNANADECRVKHAREGNRAQGKVAAEKGDRLRHSYSQIGKVRLFMLSAAVHIQGTVPAERRVLDARQEQVSCPVKSEVTRFEQERIEYFFKRASSISLMTCSPRRHLSSC